MDDKALEELALQEILKDLKRGAERAKEHGALGWQKNPAPPPNKRFLRNMLVSTLRDKRPLNNRFKLLNQSDSSNHDDSRRKRSIRSETFIYHKDRGRQKQDSLDKRNGKRKYPFPEYDCREASLLTSQPESRNSGKRQEEACRELTAGKDKDTCDLGEEKHCAKKRCTAVIVISDSDEEEKNWDTKDRKRRKRKHRKVTDVKDTHSRDKKKHKKTKKSKRHKSETSGHSSKHKL